MSASWVNSESVCLRRSMRWPVTFVASTAVCQISSIQFGFVLADRWSIPVSDGSVSSTTINPARLFSRLSNAASDKETSRLNCAVDTVAALFEAPAAPDAPLLGYSNRNSCSPSLAPATPLDDTDGNHHLLALKE